jgi:hypothetical protein
MHTRCAIGMVHRAMLVVLCMMLDHLHVETVRLPPNHEGARSVNLGFGVAAGGPRHLGAKRREITPKSNLPTHIHIIRSNIYHVK